ncbi:MAG: hypothetical protein LBM71_00905 [Elusimicrobiota bacterium]|jgi:hypothetical protein|nr:hypothetical protein [Elusimicrobiota bacterium]
MQNNDYSKVVFRGYRRVFLLIFTLAMLLQAAAFLQDRAKTALNLINSDFRLVITLNNVSNLQAADFQGKLTALKDVKEVSSIDPMRTLAKATGSSSRLKAATQAINPDFLPKFFELKVNTQAMLNPKVWVQNNIAVLEPNAAVYYKEDQARLAVYLNGLVNFVNIILLAALFGFLSFGFFVEAYYTKISSFRERAGGLFSACLSYALAFGVVYFAATALNTLAPALKYEMFSHTQILVFALCLAAGWTLAKWKKF